MHSLHSSGKHMAVLCWLLLLCSCSRAQPLTTASVEQLIGQQDWFTLQKVYEERKDSLSPFTRALAQAFLSSAFNRPEAIDQLTELAQRYPFRLGYENSIDLTLKIALDLHSQHRNREAVAVMRELIAAIRHEIDPETLSYFQRLEKQFARLSGYKLYHIQRPAQDTELPLVTRLLPQDGSAFLFAASLNGTRQQAMLDTGAGANFLSAELAARYPLTVIDDSVRVTGVQTDFGKLVLADSLRIGDILFCNVPFYVMDMSTRHPEADTYLESLDLIIGLPLLLALQEVQLDFRNHRIRFPHQLSERPMPYSNLCIEQGSLLVELSGQGERLVMQLDSGSGLSSLSHNYFWRHQKEIEATGIASDTYIAGIGGIREIPIYYLSDFPFAINGNEKRLSHIVVETEESGVSYEDGMFGADMFSAFGNLTINLKDMFVETEKRAD